MSNNTLFIAIVNLIDLGGNDDIKRHELQATSMLSMGYSIIIFADIYPEVVEIIKKNKTYSIAHHDKIILLYSRQIHGKHPLTYYGAHECKVVKVKCEGFNVIIYHDVGIMLDPKRIKYHIEQRKDTLLVTITAHDAPEIIMESKNPNCSGIAVLHSEGKIGNYSVKDFVKPYSDFKYLTLEMYCDKIGYNFVRSITMSPTIEDFEIEKIETKSATAKLQRLKSDRRLSSFISPEKTTIDIKRCDSSYDIVKITKDDSVIVENKSNLPMKTKRSKSDPMEHPPSFFSKKKKNITNRVKSFLKEK
jgi:hypothetical protein